MEKHQIYKSISGEVDVRKMQRVLEQLLAEIRNRSRDIRLDVTWLTRESQKRLMKYKELFYIEVILIKQSWIKPMRT